MVGAAPVRWRRRALPATAALIVLACAFAFETEAAARAPAVADELWAVHVDRAVAPAVRPATLRRLRGTPVNALIVARGVRAREVARLRRLGSRAGLAVLAASRPGRHDALGRPRCRVATMPRPIRCLAIARSPSQALRLARRGAAAVVLLRVRSTDAFRALGGASGPARIVAVLDLGRRSAFRDSASWDEAIGIAAEDARLDVAIAPRRRGLRAVVTTYAALVAARARRRDAALVADTAPPSAPQGMGFAGKTQTSVSLVWWAARDNVGVAGYYLYQDGVRIAATPQLGYTFTGLVCGTSYTFALAAYDAAGNVSNGAEATGRTTTEPCDASPLPAPASLFVAPSGSDANPCSPAAPCASFQRAYDLAQPGATVDVAGGHYPGQGLSPNGKTGPNIVFREASGARVILGGLSVNGADFLTFEGFETSYVDATHQRGVFAGPGSRGIRFERIDAGSVSSWKADGITVLGGDYGPCYSPPVSCSNNKVDVSRNVVIDGATFHDLLARPGDHWECMYVNASDGFTLRNSKFRGCAIFDVFLTISGPDAAAMGHEDVLIENNWFESAWTESGPTRGWTALSLAWCQNAAQPSYRNVTVRHNSFQNGAGIERDLNAAAAGCRFQNVRVIGNLAAYAGCQSGFTYAYNVWQGSGSCATTERNVASFPYANGSHGAAQDYHLASGAASIEDVVPYTAGCAPSDIDGQARPAGPACEAGADER
jgi:hypothetical protein